MESLEEQVAGIAIRVSKCEDQVIRLSRDVPCMYINGNCTYFAFKKSSSKVWECYVIIFSL